MNEAELTGLAEPDEVYSGLRTQDLQEAKDQLLVETSDMLHIPLFTAEALLRDNGRLKPDGHIYQSFNGAFFFTPICTFALQSGRVNLFLING